MRIILPTAVLLMSALWLAFQLKNDDPAIAFLNALTDDQREIAVFDPSENSREFWSYLPAAMMPRAGIQLTDLSDQQKSLAFDLLRSSLSAKGYSKAERIIMLENVLAEIDGNPDFRDPDKYHIAFYGDPASDVIWSWSFEGHHLSLNFTSVDGQLAVAPRFLGASPATILSGPQKGERTLAAETDLGLELIQKLNPAQKAKAVFSDKAYLDIVTGNAIEVQALESVGIAYNELNDSQKEILNSLINEYVSTLPDKLAEERMEQIQQEELDDLRFGWAGPVDKEMAHYYRIQGKTFLVEFDQAANNYNHIHTVWRDFSGDFGRDLIKEHYMKSGHH